MKAWHCEDSTDPVYSTVVFAETKGKARALAQHTDACEDLDFTDIRVLRAPALDQFYRGLPEMDWYHAEDRIALVRYGGYQCSYDLLDDGLDCHFLFEGKYICDCPAAEWCGRYDNIREETTNG